MAERVEEALDGVGVGSTEASGLRVALSPWLFNGMLVNMAAVAVVLHRTTGSRQLAWSFAKGRARNLLWMLGVTVHMRGLEHLATGGPFVFTSNHQSHLDILSLLAHLPGATRFAAKQDLWQHPVIGSVLDTLGMIPVDRDEPERAIETLNRAASRGDSFVIFPEGTRSRDGRLLPFKKGAFVLAIRLGLPVVPLVCRGTRRLMPRGKGFRVLPGDVEVVIGAPIATTGLRYEDRDALAERVRTAIEEHHTGW